MTIQQRREVPLMFYDLDGSIEDSDHRLYLAKVRIKDAKPGKYQDRPKSDRPTDKLAAIKAERCDKFKITDPTIGEIEITVK